MFKRFAIKHPRGGDIDLLSPFYHLFRVLMRLQSQPSIFPKDLATVKRHSQNMKQAADQDPGVAQRTKKSMQVLLPRQVYVPLYLNVLVPYT